MILEKEFDVDVRGTKHTGIYFMSFGQNEEYQLVTCH